jgi:hypothetical protein
LFGTGTTGDGLTTNNTGIVGSTIAGRFDQFNNAVANEGARASADQVRGAVEGNLSVARSSIEGQMTGGVAPLPAGGGTLAGPTNAPVTGTPAERFAAASQAAQQVQPAEPGNVVANLRASVEQGTGSGSGTGSIFAGGSGNPATGTGAGTAGNTLARQELERIGDSIAANAVPQVLSANRTAAPDGTISSTGVAGGSGATLASASADLTGSASNLTGLSPAATTSGATGTTGGGSGTPETVRPAEPPAGATTYASASAGNPGTATPLGSATTSTTSTTASGGGSSGGLFGTGTTNGGNGVTANNSNIVGERIAGNYQQWEKDVTAEGQRAATEQVRGAVENNSTVARGSLEGTMTGSVNSVPAGPAGGRTPTNAFDSASAAANNYGSSAGGATYLAAAATSGGTASSGTTSQPGTTAGGATVNSSATSSSSATNNIVANNVTTSNTNALEVNTAVTGSSNTLAREQLTRVADTIGSTPDVLRAGGSNGNSPNPAMFGTVSKNREDALDAARGKAAPDKAPAMPQYLAKSSALAASRSPSTSKLASALGRAATNAPPATDQGPAVRMSTTTMPPKTIHDPLGSVAAGTTLRRSRYKRKASQAELDAMEKLGGANGGSMSVE